MIPVLVELNNGRFFASIANDPKFRAEGASRDEAVRTLESDLQAKVARGEIVWINIPKRAITDFAGSFQDDPELDEIVREAYRLRDEQKAAEFPE